MLAAAAVGNAHTANRLVKVLVVGDSVAATLSYEPSMESGLAKGMNVKFDLQVCRRLTTPGCPYAGTIPASVLQVVQASGRGSDVLVVDVGYNDDPSLYGGAMAKVIRAAKGVGIKKIVWVSLKEALPLYAKSNAAIRAEAQRFQGVQIADWNAWSAGKPWFRSDGLHLTLAGADGLALMLRVYILSAAQSAG